MNRLQRHFLLLLAALLLAAGCAKQTALIPPDVHYGFDTCADCGMVIADQHYAAALAWRTAPDEQVQTAAFDDIGCLLAWQRSHAKAKILAIWVKNVRSAEWLDAPSATFAKSERLHTPMGSGIIAGSGRNDFVELAVQAPLLSWTNLLDKQVAETDATASASHDGHSQ